MSEYPDVTLRISPDRGEISVDTHQTDGAICHKSITAQTLMDCLLSSRYDEDDHATGLLPENCIAAVMGTNCAHYYIRYPELYADISYYGTEYLHFPLPRLVFAFKHLSAEGKVAGCRVCVVKDERLTPDTPTYSYPFSNVGGGGHICTGNNALPAYKDPVKLHTLAGYILRLPNNDDYFSPQHNQGRLGYRDLLEHLKDKPPAYYYSDVLVEDRRTLRDFLNGR